MFKAGFSIYTGLDDYPLKRNLEYLELASSLGYEFIFSSAHINEATDAFDELQTIVTEAHKKGIKLILDVSKPMMDRFKMPENLYSLRLDYGFTKEDIVELSKTSKCKIELNASTLSKKEIEELISKGLNTENVRTSFNFYPKLYTGHSIDLVKEKLELFKSYNMSTLIFIPSKVGKRPPMYEGLPSIEKHRYMNLDVVIEELKSLGVDEIAFGDAYASFQELELLKSHQVEHMILPFKKVSGVSNDIISSLTNIFRVRPDYNNYMLRCSGSRGVKEIEPFNTVERHFGDVTIDNSGFKRYKGEINIVTCDLPQDARVNVIGHVELTTDMIEALKKGQRYTFGVSSND